MWSRMYLQWWEEVYIATVSKEMVINLLGLRHLASSCLFPLTSSKNLHCEPSKYPVKLLWESPCSTQESGSRRSS